MSHPDRSRLPISRQSFSGVANRTLDGSEPDWDLIGAVGFAVGLFSPPLLAATAVGAAMGAAGGDLLHRRISSKLGEQAGETIPLGGAGLIVAYSHSEADTVEPAVTRAVQKTIGEAEGNHVAALKGALADAQRKLSESNG